MDKKLFILGLTLIILITPIQTQGFLNGIDTILPEYQPVLREISENTMMKIGETNSLFPLTSIKGITQYQEYLPIKIFNDSAFGSTGYNFTGTGILGDPYRIENYSITASSETLIHIENTSKYFDIDNCNLNGINKGFSGIYLKNVTHGKIANTVLNSISYGIHLDSSSNNTISDNIISDTSQRGIYYFDGNYSVINNNFITNISSIGIALGAHTYSKCHSNIVANNTIEDCTSDGIRVGSFCSYNLLIGNSIANVAGYGIFIRDRNHANTIVKNFISNTGSTGIHVWWYSSGTNITDNIIRNAKGHGIGVHTVCDYGVITGNIILNAHIEGISVYNCDNSSITRNTFYNSTSYAIHIYSNSYNTELKWNSFFHNNGGQNQALDDGVTSFFDYNHWNDHVEPDTDIDGIVDTIYPIDFTEMETDDGLRLTGTTTSFSRISPVATFASDAISVELWMKSLDNSHDFSLVSYASSSSTNDFLFYYDVSDDEVEIYVQGALIGTGCSVNENEWTHLVVTWQSSDGETTLWKNGLLQYTGNLSKGMTFGTGGSLVFGQDQDSVGGGFQSIQAYNGILDEVRIFNRTIDQSEIQSDFNTKPPYQSRTGTIGWYHLEAPGVNDSSNGIGNATTSTGIEWSGGVQFNIDSHPRISPIWINENSDYQNFTSIGDGTENNPYIIQNLVLASNKSVLIHISNTTDYFVIQACELNGINKLYEGIFLYNVTHGSLISNDISFCSTGIKISSNCQENSLSNNTADLNAFNGYWIGDSSKYNNLTSNIASWNGKSGFLLNEAHNNTLTKNTGSENLIGFILIESTNNTLVSNNADENSNIGFVIQDFSNTNTFNLNSASKNGETGFHLYNNTCYNNLTQNTASNNVNIGFNVDSSSNFNQLNENTAIYNSKGIIIEESHNNSLCINIASENTISGISLSSSSNNTLLANNVYENNGEGFKLDNSHNNVLLNNTANDNLLFGFYLTFSSNNTLNGNSIIYNKDYGLSLEFCSENIIYFNYVLMNGKTPQAYDDSVDNNWTNGTHGNVWSDYTGTDTGNGIGDISYNLDGSAGAKDSKPIIPDASMSTLKITGPEDIYIDVTTDKESYLIEWNATSNFYPTSYKIYKEDSIVWAPAETWKINEPIFWHVDILTLEEEHPYNYTLLVIDSTRKLSVDTVMVTVTDTIKPEIMNLSPSEYNISIASGNTTIELTLSITDYKIDNFKLNLDDITIASWNMLMRDYGSFDFSEYLSECWLATSGEVTEGITVYLDSLSISSHSMNLVSRIEIDFASRLSGIYNYTFITTDHSGNTNSVIFTVNVSGGARNTPGWALPFVLFSLVCLSRVHFKRRSRWKNTYNQSKDSEKRRNKNDC